MAFYDGLGQGIKNFGQGAVQGGRNLAETAKLNTEIGALEREINAAYAEIGRVYCRKYAPTATDTEILAQLHKISSNMNLIEQKRQQIRVIKGIVKCKNCGADIDVHAVICNVCGARQIPETVYSQTNGAICPQCGSPVGEGQLFCTNCGCKLEQGSTMQRKVCRSCGAQLREGQLFCMNCGTKVLEEAIQNDSDFTYGDDSTSGEGGSLESESVDTVDGINGMETRELTEETPVPEEITYHEPTIEICEPRENMEKRCCAKCGAPLAADAIFCTECGEKVFSR